MRVSLSLLCITLGFAFACAGSAKSPKFKVHEMRLDDSCAKLLDYCVTARCMVENVGEAAGSATVEFQLSGATKSVVTGVASKLIAAGELAEVTYDFPEATLTTNAHVQCSLRDPEAR